MEYRTYGVIARDREPLLAFMLEALEGSGCRILHVSEPDRATFRITFETSMGERMGIVAYAFFANSRLTRNRPPDEHRFQIKYGSEDKKRHEVWQDPYELYTTLFLGINPDLGFFVGADPILHSPTRFFISLEFKQAEVDEVLSQGWHAWERIKRDQHHNLYPIEVLVGGTKASFLRYVRLERAAKGLGPGHRQLLADKLDVERLALPALAAEVSQAIAATELPHAMTEELQLSHTEILDLIASAPRLKMAARGWVAEVHLKEQLERVPGVEECGRPEDDPAAHPFSGHSELLRRALAPLVDADVTLALFANSRAAARRAYVRMLRGERAGEWAGEGPERLPWWRPRRDGDLSHAGDEPLTDAARP